LLKPHHQLFGDLLERVNRLVVFIPQSHLKKEKKRVNLRTGVEVIKNKNSRHAECMFEIDKLQKMD
jgi:hypothetical protein